MRHKLEILSVYVNLNKFVEDFDWVSQRITELCRRGWDLRKDLTIQISDDGRYRIYCVLEDTSNINLI